MGFSKDPIGSSGSPDDSRMMVVFSPFKFSTGREGARSAHMLLLPFTSDSSSLGTLSNSFIGQDVFALAIKALEAMKEAHDYELVITKSLLERLQTRYYISNEYKLHIPWPEGCPYDLFPNRFRLSYD
ncbi:hypothetical protein BHM03_00014253 [Ensete ventricosum]|nr:hypothetical protein BHM03_00014253 [Ensete ventricosum]